MKEKDIKQLEVKLGYALPKDYRDFLLNKSLELAKAKKFLLFYAVLWSNPRQILKENKLVRKYADDMLVGTKEEPWPENFVVVGSNGGGDYWFIYKDEQKKGLWFWSHETQRIKKYDATFDVYLLRIEKALLTPEKWQ